MSEIKNKFISVFKKRFNLKTLGVLVATAYIINYFKIGDKILAYFPSISPDNMFFQVIVIGTVFQFIKVIVELLFENGFG